MWLSCGAITTADYLLVFLGRRWPSRYQGRVLVGSAAELFVVVVVFVIARRVVVFAISVRGHRDMRVSDGERAAILELLLLEGNGRFRLR